MSESPAPRSLPILVCEATPATSAKAAKVDASGSNRKPRPGAQSSALRRRTLMTGLAAGVFAPPLARAAQRPLEALTIGDRRALVARAKGLPADAPLLVLHPGLGAPADPAALMAALPPPEGCVSVYAPLPFTDADGRVGDDLVARQQDDYVASLMAPLLRQASEQLPQLIALVTSRFMLAADRPVALFGFSAGGAASLAALRHSAASLDAVVALNAPLSLRQAATAYERRIGRPYSGRALSDPSIFATYDLAAQAETIRRRRPRTRIVILQSADDDQFGVAGARGAAVALAGAEVHILAGGGHNLLAGAADDLAAASRREVQVRLANVVGALARRRPKSTASLLRPPRHYARSEA